MRCSCPENMAIGAPMSGPISLTKMTTPLGFDVFGFRAFFWHIIQINLENLKSTLAGTFARMAPR